jgi:hypothetical protein
MSMGSGDQNPVGSQAGRFLDEPLGFIGKRRGTTHVSMTQRPTRCKPPSNSLRGHPRIPRWPILVPSCCANKHKTPAAATRHPLKSIYYGWLAMDQNHPAWTSDITRFLVPEPLHAVVVHGTAVIAVANPLGMKQSRQLVIRPASFRRAIVAGTAEDTEHTFIIVGRGHLPCVSRAIRARSCSITRCCSSRTISRRVFLRAVYRSEANATALTPREEIMRNHVCRQNEFEKLSFRPPTNTVSTPSR